MIKNGLSIEEISNIFISHKNSEEDEEKMAMQEYLVLKDSCLEDAEDDDFIADKEVPDEFEIYISGIAKIKRLREVRALCSFSRINLRESHL